MKDESSRSARQARQKTTVIVLSVFLIVGGIVVLLFLKRVPLPLRILGGLVDIVAGCVLLILIRQDGRGK